MKIAIVHDCLTVVGGAEKVLREILNVFPEADIFSIINFLPESFLGKKVHTSFIQKFPFAKKIYRLYFPLMPYAVENFDLSSYDLIISSSYAVAKGVITSPDQLHLTYCHSPMRYCWDLQHTYFPRNHMIANFFLHKLRLWDVASSMRVDRFVANSHFIKKRILKTYRRDAKVIYPPVDTERFSADSEKLDFYLTCTRLTKYKRVDLMVQAFAQMPEKKLVILGSGPEYKNLIKMATPNISFIQTPSDETVKYYMEKACGFVFAAKEDFGIVCVEAQSAGTGVIAFGQGGALETVRGLDEKDPTGCFFYRQTVEDLSYAILQFEKNRHRISRINCRQNAEKFSKERFKQEFRAYVLKEYENYESNFACRGQRRASMAHFSEGFSETIFPH